MAKLPGHETYGFNGTVWIVVVHSWTIWLYSVPCDKANIFPFFNMYSKDPPNLLRFIYLFLEKITFLGRISLAGSLAKSTYVKLTQFLHNPECMIASIFPSLPPPPHPNMHNWNIGEYLKWPPQGPCPQSW